MINITKITLTKTYGSEEKVTDVIYPKTTADMVEWNDRINLKQKIDDLENRIIAKLSEIQIQEEP